MRGGAAAPWPQSSERDPRRAWAWPGGCVGEASQNETRVERCARWPDPRAPRQQSADPLMTNLQDTQDRHARRVRAERDDDLDEELEMALEEDIEHRLSRLLDGLLDAPAEGETSERIRYFRELFRLQAELVKLQDWVVAQKQKIVIV